ncbi:hypothetical protein OAN13_05185 [Opitutales bacterium]|nr:hypothetical protein [Opitutales bacterium]
MVISYTDSSGISGSGSMAKWAYKLYDPSYGTPFSSYSSNHGGTQVDYSNTEYGFMGGQSDGEYTVYVTLLDSSGDMFNPPITYHVSFTYQSSAGNPSSPGDGYQSSTGDSISIHYPDVSVLYSSGYNGMQVQWNYQSQSNDMQSLSWAYKLDEDFYGTSTSATQVDGNDSVDGSSWLSGVSYGNHTLYVALLDLVEPSNVLASDSLIFTYQGGSSGTQSGDGTYQSDDGGYQSDDSGYQSEDGISIHYPDVSVLYSSGYNGMQVQWNYQSQSNNMQSLSWAYKLDEDFYGTSTSATQVDGNDSVDGSDWLSGLSYGSHTLYVALLDQVDPSNVLASDSHIFTYQSGSSGTQSGDGTYQSDDGSYQSESAGVNEILLENPIANAHLYGWETLSVSLQYAFDDSGYSSPRWSYKINEDFYSTQSSATEVNGYQVDGWLEGLNSGYHTIYVALLDPLGGDQILAQDNSTFNFSKPNSAPTNLFLSNNTVEENVPDSSIVGVFSATDADGDDLHYHFYNLGESPEILSGFKAYYYEREFTENGTQYESGRAYFYDTNVSHRADNEEEWEEEGYVYEKTGPSTGILSLSNGTWVAELTFDEHKRGTGEWTETIEQETLNGSIEINFEKIGESPDSLVGLQGNFYQNSHQHLESFTITVGEYTLENGEYIYSGVDRNIMTNVHCDVFSLSADSDEHNESAHTHYYAVSNAWYDRYSKTLNWTDYGPAIDEATVEEMCQMGSGGTYKSASSESYTQDGEIYLKIISVESNQPWFEDYRMQGNLMEINGTTLTFSSWNEELEIEERETKEYVYEKTGTETGVLSFNDGSVDVELIFNAYGDGHGEWHIESTEGNVSGWSGIHLWNYGFEDPHHSNPSVRFWMESNGTLRTQGTIDYESVQASVGIIVTADDGRGGSVSEQFEITILDVFEDLDEDGIEDHLDEDNDNDGFSDEEEIVKGTDPLDAGSKPNSPPTNLILSNNEVIENTAYGTVVGEFSATDIDGDDLYYHLYHLGESPESLSGYKAHYNDREFTLHGTEYESGNAYFYDSNISHRRDGEEVWEKEDYLYEKTGASTGILKLNDGTWVAELVFDEYNHARGDWIETKGAESGKGYIELSFQKIGESPESLDGLYGHLDQWTHESQVYSLRLGEYILENGEYVFTGEERTFETDTYCQTFSRTVETDEDTAIIKKDYFAVGHQWYNGENYFSWTEYGPAEDAVSAEEMCHMGTEGTSYSVNDYDYTLVGGVYLRIIGVESDKPWLSDYRRNQSINEINGSALISRYWDEEMQTEVQTVESYVYEKTGEDKGVLILYDGNLEIDLTFNADGHGYGGSEWNASIAEGNLTGWFNVNLWGYGSHAPQDGGEYISPVRFRLESNGTLRTESQINYESGPASVGILVRVNDDKGEFIEENFEIKILDEFEDFDGDGLEDHVDPDDDGDGFSDKEEIAYPSDPRDANSVANVAPDSLYLSKAEVLENQSIGTLVGLFAGNDPDGDELTYRIIPNHNADDYHDQLVQEESTRRSGTLDDYGYIDYSQLESYGYDDLGPDGMVGTGDEYMFIDPLTGEIIYSEPFGDVDLGPDGLPGAGDEYTLDGSEFDPTFYDPDYGYIDPVADPYYDDAEIDEPYLGDFTGNDPLGDNDDYESTSVDIPFDLDENGKLTTNSELDYETDPTSYEISVEVTDPHGFSLVKEFTIKLLNEVEDLDGDGIEDHYDLDDDGDGFSDEEEIAYPSDPRDANSVANVAPDSLYLSNAEILENQPIGTIIGIFEGTDQDGDDLSYFETNNISSFEEHETILRANNGQAVVGLVDGQYRYGNLNGLTVWTVFSTTLNSSVSWRIRTGFHDNNVSYGVEGVFDQLPVEGVDSGEYLINEQGIYIWRGLLEYSIISVDNGIVRSSVKSTSSDYVGVFGDSFLFFSKEDAQSFYNAKSKGLDTESFFEEETPISVNESFRPFTLEKNGTLILTNELDFETDPSSFNVEVTVLDSHGESYQKTFKIDLLNIVEDLDGDGEEDHYDLDDDGDGFSDAVEIENSFNPRSRFNRPELALVQTLTSVYGIDNSYKLRGRLNTTGGVPLHELGFLVVGGNIDGTDLLLIDTNVTEGGEFSISLPNPVLGQSYVYRAYASNIAGSSTGSPRKFTVDESNNWWLGAEELGGGWKSNWIGVFLPQPNGWAYHTDLGWAFISPDSNAGIWFWVEGDGWHWTRDGIWPFMWSNTTSDWLYTMKSGGRTFIYDYSTESFISDF